METGEACLRGLREGLDMMLIGNNLKNQARHSSTYTDLLIKALDTDAVLISRTQLALEWIRERKARFARGKI